MTQTRWEYRVLLVSQGWGLAGRAKNIEEELNKLGQEGWELVAEQLPFFFLKRPIP